MGSKRQTTFAKMERERKVREKRALKQEKKQAAIAARNAPAVEEAPSLDGSEVDAAVEVPIEDS
ncbi:MAG TPA: hypothetical protein VIU81_05700 [Gaiellaceae bacterium]